MCKILKNRYRRGEGDEPITDPIRLVLPVQGVKNRKWQNLENALTDFLEIWQVGYKYELKFLEKIL